MAQPEKVRFPVHPLVARLTAGGKEPESTVQFAGYFGESDQAGKVRLYLTLNDLSQYLEFDESDVVFTADAPGNQMPGKGVFVWLKADSPIRACHMRVHVNQARIIASAIAGSRRRTTRSRAYGRRTIG